MRSALRVSAEYCFVSVLAFIVHSPRADDATDPTAPSEGDHEIIIADTAQSAKAGLAIIAAFVLSFENCFLEYQGRVLEVHAMGLEIGQPLWFVPLEDDGGWFTNVDTPASELVVGKT
jgi:hypothetical protein